jgi:hypothetical protein
MLYQLSYPRAHTRFYPAQDLLAPGIFNNTETDGRRDERFVGDSSQEDRWCTRHQVTVLLTEGGARTSLRSPLPRRFAQT